MLSLVTVLAFLEVSAATPEGFQFIVPVAENWQSSLPKMPPPRDWWALCRDGEAASLRAVKVRVRREPDHDVSRCGKSYRFSVAGCSIEESILWLRGLPGLASRAVPTVLVANWREYNFQGQRRFKKWHGRHREIVVKDDEIVVRDGERVQKIPHSSLSDIQLRWIGDLDGDGILDFWLSEFDGTDGGVNTLYLSADSPSGMLVHEAAARSGSGC